MYNFVVCSVFKNESHILDEWINHYLYHGVDHIYLLNDFSNDNYINIINKYTDKVTLFHNDIVTKEVGRQNLLHNKYFKNLFSVTKWMAILDMDEFLYSPNHININDILKEYDQYSQILVDWVHFGSNGHITQPKSVVEGFTMRAFYGKNKGYYSYKSIFKTEYFISFINVHSHTMNGPTIRLHSTETQFPKLLINHYNLQSLDFFLKVKGTRGDVNNWFENMNLKRNKEFFLNFDDNDSLDLRLYEQNKDIIKLL
jgi:hypothetical protein